MERPDLQAFHPFTRLNRLLAGLEPGRSPAANGEPLLFSIGEPQRQPPAFITEVLAANAKDWSRYPPPRGLPDFCRAAAGWLQRRYKLPENLTESGGLLDPQSAILPVPGTREGLYFATLATVAAADKGPRPVVLIPNPFYHVYAGAAVAAGAEPVFVPADPAQNHMPDFTALDPAILERTAYCVYCTPANPQGGAASIEQMQALIRLAREFDFIVAFDECYSELYTDRPPPGALQAALGLGDSLDHMLSFHSLSKRSSAPGLRCGFVVGDSALVEQLAVLLQVGGAGVSIPVQAVGARLWADDAHVEEMRAFYRANFEAADAVFAAGSNQPVYQRPEAGFFLWLETGDGEAACKALWQEAGIKTLPGAYMASTDETGLNPGRDFLRVALVHDAAIVRPALARLAEVLS